GSFFKRHAVTTPTHKAWATRLPRLVGTRFQVLFHNPSPGHFSPFPHGTRPLSVTREYLGLPDGPGRFTRDSSGPVLLGTPSQTVATVSPTRLSRSTAAHSKAFGYHDDFSLPGRPADRPRELPQPRTRNARRLSHAHGLASSAFAHHY